MKEKKQSTHSLKRSQVSAFRLIRHHLTGRHPAEIIPVCRGVCGIQAQVMGAAQVALWARRHDVTRAELHSALWERRTLVKTPCMRGTLHLLAASDFPIYLKALQGSLRRQLFRIWARYGVTVEEANRVTHAVIDALGDGPVGRRELTKRVLSLNIVGKKARKWFELSSWGVSRQAMVEGLVCYGPDRGQEVTMVRSDQWLAKAEDVSEEEAQRILLRRYLSAYGPATVRDFSHWTGIPMAEARAIWTLLQGELAEVESKGERGWILDADRDQLGSADLGEQVLRLLPSFDPYLLAHADKDHLVDPRYYKRVYRNQGWISPVVLLNGRVLGVWSHQRRGNRVSIKVEPFGSFSKSVRAKIEEEAASLAHFLEAPWEIRFTN